MSSGDLLATLNPLSNTPPSANFATFDTRNSHAILDFDDTTSESCVFGNLVMPSNYAGGGLTIVLGIAMTSATTNAVVFSAAMELVGNSSQDIDSDGFATAVNSSSITVNGTTGNVFDVTITLTDGAQMDSVTAGDRFRLKIARLPADGGDTAAGDAELWSARVREA